MESFVRRQNIEHFKELLKITKDPVERRLIEKLLRDEEALLKRAEAESKNK